MRAGHPLAGRRHGRGGGTCRRPGRPAVVVVAALVVLAGGLSGCSGGGDAPDQLADGPTAAPSAGRYAVATPAPQVLGTPTATAGGYQLVAAGDPVHVRLPGADLVAQVSGPDVTLPAPTPGQPVTARSAPGVLTVALTSTRGTLRVDPASFLGLDQTQRPITLRPDARQVTVSPGRPVTLHLSSQFDSGHTTLTWQPLGRPLVTWDFVVEID